MKRNSQEAKNLSRRDFVKTTAGGVGAAALTGFGANEAEAQNAAAAMGQTGGHRCVGAGASGLPAAIEAIENGASVILIDANFDVGGHAIVSGGNIALGGGTSRQRKYGIEDSPDIVFRDLTDWSVIEPNGFPDYRHRRRSTSASVLVETQIAPVGSFSMAGPFLTAVRLAAELVRRLSVGCLERPCAGNRTPR